MFECGGGGGDDGARRGLFFLQEVQRVILAIEPSWSDVNDVPWSIILWRGR